LERFDELHVLGLHDPGEDVAVLSAGPTPVALENGVNRERGPFVVVKRTKALEIPTGLFKLNPLADESDYIDSSSNLVDLASQLPVILCLAGSDYDSGHYLRPVRAKSGKSERNLILHEESDHDVVAVDLISVRRVVLLNQLGKGRSKAHPAGSSNFGIGEANSFDLNDSIGLVENKSILGTASVVNPASVEDTSAASTSAYGTTATAAAGCSSSATTRSRTGAWCTTRCF
jgi:hypothetical protein